MEVTLFWRPAEGWPKLSQAVHPDFLPRIGDTVSAGGFIGRVEKVEWVASSTTQVEVVVVPLAIDQRSRPKP